MQSSHCISKLPPNDYKMFTRDDFALHTIELSYSINCSFGLEYVVMSRKQIKICVVPLLDIQSRVDIL